MTNNLSGNLLASLPDVMPKEIEQLLLTNGQITIKRILSRGQSSPVNHWYDQEDNEWVLVVQGEGILSFENEEDLHMKQGDYCYIPAHKKHRVSWTLENQVTIWLAFHFPVQEESK